MRQVEERDLKIPGPQPDTAPAGDILIVDDMPDNLNILFEVLTAQGHQVRLATSGAQALAAVQHQLPGLILLDIMMPGMGGYEVCRQLKANAQTKNIPVIFVSALSETENKTEAFTVGGVDYITKPFQVSEVLSRVETHLALHNLQQSLEQEVAAKQALISELDALNAQLQRKVAQQEQAEKTLRTYMARLQILHDIDQAILAAQSPENIALATVGRIRQLIPCQRAMIVAVTGPGQVRQLASEASTGAMSQVDMDARQQMFDEKVLRQGHVWGIADLDALAVRSPIQQALYDEGVRAFVVIPLFVSGELVGILDLEAHHPQAFTAEHISIAIEIAALMTVAIRQVRLYELAQQEIAEREQAQAALRQQAIELEARNAELDAFAHTVAHDLKTPLTSLIGYSSLLEKRYDKMTPAKLTKSLGVITQSGRKMTSIINELLLLASIRQFEDVETGPLDMSAVVKEAQRRFADQWDERQAEMIAPAEWPTAIGYAPWVEEVWANYISNALKYGGTPPRIELGATVLRRGGAARFWVRDNGAGLSPEEQARLFSQFTRLDQTRAQGHGLGLSIVKRIVEKLGGQVGVESEAGQGSTFYFDLPLSPPSTAENAGSQSQ